MTRPAVVTVTASTGHRITVDPSWSGEWRVSLEGDLETMPDVPDAEINAACAAAGVRCRNEWRETWSPCEVLP